MDPEARRRACEEFRDKLGRDTGTHLTAAACQELLGLRLPLSHIPDSEEEVTLQTDPGLFYACLGMAFDANVLLVVPDHKHLNIPLTC